VVRHKLVAMVEGILPMLAWLQSLAHRIDAAGGDARAMAADAALAKNRAARLMRDCAGDAVQLLGGMGFMRGSRTERIWRDVKVMMIGGGAEEVLADLAARQLDL
jgi:acyl-CoA dehydrogenase